MCEIIPGILEQEWSEIERKLAIVRPLAKTVHIDLLDGKFAPNTTFDDPQPFKKYTSDMFFELHMMVDEPIQYLDAWAKAGFKRFIGQIERMGNQEAFMTKAKQLGEAGLAVDAKTPIAAVTVPVSYLDILLVMTVNAGFSGQSFMTEQLEKIQQVRKKIPIIAVDGGVNTQSIKKACQVGASRFVATSALFSQGDPKENYRMLQAACTNKS